jgi:hypothetical protein
MIIPQKRSLRQVIIAGLAALVAPLTGCVTGGSVGAFMGYNPPTMQSSLEFDSAITYGVRGGIKTKKGVEVEAEARFHDAYQNDGFQETNLIARDLSIGAVIPVRSNKGITLYTVPKLICRNEKGIVRSIGIPGSDSPFDWNSTGFGVGVGARVQAGKGSVDARVSYEGFGEGGYEESGVKFDVGYVLEF